MGMLLKTAAKAVIFYSMGIRSYNSHIKAGPFFGGPACWKISELLC